MLWSATQCGCTHEASMGRKRPIKCPHGNIYQSENQLGNTPKAQKRRKPLKRTGRKESAAERKARDHFNETVKAWPCWFAAERPCEKCGGRGGYPPAKFALGDFRAWVQCEICRGDGRHHCQSWGRKDAHHLVPKSFLRQRFQAILPEEEFVAILFNPKLGAPLCRKAHEAIEGGLDRIYFEDLSEECLEYVSSLPDFVLMRLELESPKRASSHTEGVRG